MARSGRLARTALMACATVGWMVPAGAVAWADPAEVFQAGAMRIEFDGQALSELGLGVVPRVDGKAESRLSINMPIDAASDLSTTASRDSGEALVSGSLRSIGAFLVTTTNGPVPVGNLILSADGDGRWTVASTLVADRTSELVFELTGVVVDAADGTLMLAGELTFDETWAMDHGFSGAGVAVGRVLVDASATASLVRPEPSQGGTASTAGPDVIVGDLQNTQRWGRVGDITAYSVGTTSCNMGDQRLNWFASTNQHPVIGQNMYRLKDGRFEQIGLSWMKHGFFALSGSLCTPCTDPTDGSQLGVGCSDPYSSGLNGEQSNLGPRYQVNATTGFFPYPFSAPAPAATIGRRMQVKDADIDPDLNVGAQYFVEGHYVTPDDAAAGNNNNNASYRRVTVVESSPNNFAVNNAGATQREKPGIQAWRDLDQEVRIVYVDVPNDRRLLLGYKVTDLGDGTWHYEYAIQNLNSDRSAGSFTVPVPSGVALQNIGFHDIADHSGTPYDTTDWPATHLNDNLVWATTPYETDPNANALRWGSLYNFRFDANAPPKDGMVSIGLFKPGSPPTTQVPALIPDLALMLATSDPPINAIDARQPSDIDGTDIQGWQFINLTFNGFALNVTAADFALTEVGGSAEPPMVLGVLPVQEDTITLVLSRPISVGAWTVLQHVPSGTETRIGYLPGDVNGDGTTSPVDILALIDSLNGIGTPRAPYSTDINRSGLAEPSDILRVIDLLNGAGAFDSYNGATLPE